MPRSTVQLTGVGDLEADLLRLAAQTGDIRTEIAQEWADDVRDTAQDLATVRTGRMRDAVEARVNADSTTDTGQVGIWNDNANYAQFVEQGTSSMNAQPFMQPSFERHRADVAGYARDAVLRWVQ